MNIYEVQKRLKQRPPFQMIEKVLSMEENNKAVAIKVVSINDPYFMGHFPEMPIMPGVLIIESAAQLCALTMASGELDDRIPVLLKVEEVKFIQVILPGDTMKIEVEKMMISANFSKFKFTVYVEEEKRCMGILAFSFINKKVVCN